MSTPTNVYSIEIDDTQLRGTSDEHHVRIGDDRNAVPLHDRERLRSFDGHLSDGSEIPIYVGEGSSEHDYIVYLRGEAIPVRVVTPRDERLLALRKNTSAGASGGQMVTAPMPGMLKQILVAEGAQVEKGESLCILEAMKMENEIKSPGRLVVKRLIARAGSAVEKGTPLLELRPVEG